jgi:hypothetical protein
MKISLAIVAMLLAAGSSGSPPRSVPTNASLTKRAEQAECPHRSTCGWFPSHKCHRHCARYGETYKYMDECSFFMKRCCCNDRWKNDNDDVE